MLVATIEFVTWFSPRRFWRRPEQSFFDTSHGEKKKGQNEKNKPERCDLITGRVFRRKHSIYFVLILKPSESKTGKIRRKKKHKKICFFYFLLLIVLWANHSAPFFFLPFWPFLVWFVEKILFRSPWPQASEEVYIIPRKKKKKLTDWLTSRQQIMSATRWTILLPANRYPSGMKQKIMEFPASFPAPPFPHRLRRRRLIIPYVLTTIPLFFSFSAPTKEVTTVEGIHWAAETVMRICVVSPPWWNPPLPPHPLHPFYCVLLFGGCFFFFLFFLRFFVCLFVCLFCVSFLFVGTWRGGGRSWWHQAVYTAGVVLPTPLACCRYFHRSLNPKKLIEVRVATINTDDARWGLGLALQRGVAVVVVVGSGSGSGSRHTISCAV